MGENHFASAPSALYGVVLLMAAVAYWILQRAIIGTEGRNSTLARAIGGDWKGKISPVIYVAGIAVSFRAAWVSQLLYAAVALLWLVPDRRIERALDVRPP